MGSRAGSSFDAPSFRVLAHRAGSSATLYELAWTGEGQDGSPFVAGLADLSGQGRAESGPISVGVRGHESEEIVGKVATDRDSDGREPKEPHRGKARDQPSYGGRG